MSVSRREVLAASLATLPVPALLAVMASAQEENPAAVAVGGRDANTTGRMDPLLASKVLIGGRRQIGVCELAMGRLQMDETKAFAKAEIEEHVEVKNKLKLLGFSLPVEVLGGNVGDPTAVAPNANGQTVVPGNTTTATPPTATVTTTETTPSATGTGTPAGPATARNPSPDANSYKLPAAVIPGLRIENEVVDQCLSTYKEMMSKKQGVKFEKAFIGDQLHSHTGLLDKVITFQRHASPQMVEVLKQAQGVIEQHIATCESLMEKLSEMKNNAS